MDILLITSPQIPSGAEELVSRDQPEAIMAMDRYATASLMVLVSLWPLSVRLEAV